MGGGVFFAAHCGVGGGRREAEVVLDQMAAKPEVGACDKEEEAEDGEQVEKGAQHDSVVGRRACLKVALGT